ncbi:MAG: MmgE/PrpD family protein [Rhodospirillaceae bacterium]|nr:MmgE/PrpD family protein [Rhodospirillaceae bacterium]
MPAAQTISEQFGAFAVNLSSSDIPADVRLRAQHHILDAVGIALASGRYDFSKTTLKGIQALGGTGNVPVIGMNARLSPRDAAMMNGFLIHGLDFDDTHMGGVIHPTASVIAAVLSASTMVNASGADLVTAYILGIEAATRLGSVAQGGFHQVGFHPTGIIGVFACALSVGRLLGLTDKQLTEAQGIALSMASGSLEFLEDGAWNKRLHPGWAAAAGITAAILAREGFDGITLPYEGRFGLFNAYLGKEAGRTKLALATEGLNKTWELMNTAIKPYPTCHFVHACIDAALELRKQGLDPSQIKSVEALVPADVIKVVCEPSANKKKPANSYDAQFSVPFLTAAAFMRQRLTLADIEDEALRDADILKLADKFTYRADPDSPFPKAYSGELVVTKTDGQVIRHREHINRGAADRPLTNAEIVEKYRGNAAIAVDKDKMARVETAVLTLDRANDAAALMQALSVSLH